MTEEKNELKDGQISGFELQEAAYWSDYFKAATPEIVKELGLGFLQVGSGAVTVTSKIDILAFNRVIGLGIGEAVTENQIDEIITTYRKAKLPRFFVQLSPTAQPNDLPGMLQKKGLYHHNNWVKWYKKLENIPHIETDLRIEQIDRTHAHVFADIITTSFEWPEVLKPFIAQVVGRHGWKHYLAYKGEQAVGCAACYIRGEISSLAFAATLSHYRGYGTQSALISRRFQDAISAGCKWVISETAEETPKRSAPSYRNMRRHGLDIAYLRPNYIFKSV